MRVAYFSPFSPDPSGISDFSEELLPELKKHMDVDLYSRMPIENKEMTEEFEVHMIEEFNDSVRNKYDFLVYQVGNNRKFHKSVIDTFLKYPDILEIHDLSLHHYLAEDTFVQNDFDKYIEIMKYCHGTEGELTAKKFLNGQIRAPWETDSLKYTVNKHLIDKARAVIVHSDMAKQYVKGIRVDVPVINIPLHTSDIITDYNEHKKQCKKELNISEDTLVFGSFGYATIAKRIEPIIKALSVFKKESNKAFIYCIVGKVEHIDVDKLAKEYDLEENIVVTGFTEIDEFKQYMGACDICFNLRYPTQGESSASLHRMLGMGKPILVTDIGTFEEYSDRIVLKVRYDENEISDIVGALKQLLKDEAELDSRSKAAFEYANNNCCLEKNARRYYDFFLNVAENTYKDEYMDHLLDAIQEIDFLDELYMEHIASSVLSVVGEENV